MKNNQRGCSVQSGWVINVQCTAGGCWPMSVHAETEGCDWCGIYSSNQDSPFSWQVICSMMVSVCPIMVSMSTSLSLSLSLALLATVCRTPYRATRCPTMPHYQPVSLRRPVKLRSKAAEATAQLTLERCSIRRHLYDAARLREVAATCTTFINYFHYMVMLWVSQLKKFGNVRLRIQKLKMNMTLWPGIDVVRPALPTKTQWDLEMEN